MDKYYYLVDGTIMPNEEYETPTREEWLKEKLWEDYVDTMLMQEEENDEL